jgi:DNA-binding XRE family transcriptional regulator
MVTGNEVRMARGRMRLTQAELAQQIDVAVRTISAWEALGAQDIPARAAGRVGPALGLTTGPAGDALSGFSDLELLAELLRRAAARGSGETPRTGEWVSDDMGAPLVFGASSAGNDTHYPADASASGAVRGALSDTATTPHQYRTHRRMQS